MSVYRYAMFPLVRIVLSLLRFATNTSLFLEVQRLLVRLLRRPNLPLIEAKVLSSVRTPLRHRFVYDNHEHRIHLIQVPATTTTRPVAVLLHGHSMSAAFWARNLDDFVALGYQVYAIDLLGWGRSHRPTFKGKTMQDCLQWYLGSLKAVVEQITSGKFLLVGHSLGAYLAMEYTKMYGHSVDKLVMVSPAACVRHIPLSRAVYFSLPPQIIVRRGGLLGLLLFVMKYPRRDSYISNKLRQYTYQLAMQGPASGEKAVLPIIRFCGWRAECTRPLIEHLRLFNVPVQIVVGDKDSSMPVEGVHELYDEMKRKGFRVDLTVVDRGDHCPMLERPEEFCNVLAGLAKPAAIQIC